MTRGEQDSGGLIHENEDNGESGLHPRREWNPHARYMYLSAGIAISPSFIAPRPLPGPPTKVGPGKASASARAPCFFRHAEPSWSLKTSPPPVSRGLDRDDWGNHTPPRARYPARRACQGEEDDSASLPRRSSRRRHSRERRLTSCTSCPSGSIRDPIRLGPD